MNINVCYISKSKTNNKKTNISKKSERKLEKKIWTNNWKLGKDFIMDSPLCRKKTKEQSPITRTQKSLQSPPRYFVWRAITEKKETIRHSENLMNNEIFGYS